MERCHLKGEQGDRLHAVLCAAGYNIRWLRIPCDGGHDSTLMADSVPPSWRTPFHGDGGQHSILMADT
jgi:hypothetical protein